MAIKIEGKIVCEEPNCGCEEQIILGMSADGGGGGSLSFLLPNGWVKWGHLRCPKHPRPDHSLGSAGRAW
jgi:hypothetical protein